MLINIKKISSNLGGVLGTDKPRMLRFLLIYVKMPTIMLFVQLINVKMPTIVGILTFMSRENFMFS